MLKNATLPVTPGLAAIHNYGLHQQILVSSQKKKRTWELLNHIDKWSQLIIYLICRFFSMAGLTSILSLVFMYINTKVIKKHSNLSFWHWSVTDQSYGSTINSDRIYIFGHFMVWSSFATNYTPTFGSCSLEAWGQKELLLWLAFLAVPKFQFQPQMHSRTWQLFESSLFLESEVGKTLRLQKFRHGQHLDNDVPDAKSEGQRIKAICSLTQPWGRSL